MQSWKTIKTILRGNNEKTNIIDTYSLAKNSIQGIQC